jgi:hypothetical protein
MKKVIVLLAAMLVAAGKFKWASPLLLLLMLAAASAHVLRVPEEYSTIQGAMNASDANDTVLVNRGTYPEQLYFFEHRISVMSYYEVTGDTLDVTETIIDGSSYAGQNDAALAIFDPFSEDSC